jgi:short-subunit dehydrogenase
VFIHNALYFWGGRAYMGEGDPANNKDEIIANTVAPLVLGDMFIRAAQPAVDAGVDCGLVQISSASARIAYPGLAIYGASKAAMEQWVRAVRAERDDRGKGPWVSAIRPGFVDTPAARRDAALPEDTYPGVAGIAEAVREGNFLTAEESAENIWNSIPDACIAKPVLLFGEAVGVTT